MKIHKKNEHSVLIKPVGFRGKLFLAVTILTNFDLTAPETPLTEQELWSAIPGELPKGHVLDQGLPKPKGEVLVSGACCAPRDTQWTGAEISFRVGDLSKRLLVFGDRFRKRSSLGPWEVTSPEPFSAMPAIYENAFGGPEYELNPSGKGLKPTESQGGEPHVPLPNIEDPCHLVASPEDRPHPAGFGPLDMMWPQRARKTGSYDEKWLKERWPFFPDDIDVSFFNAAPEDQQRPGFFQGDENLEIVHMNPDVQIVASHLPGLRIRCFATKKTDLEAAVQAEEIFSEITTRIDTVWLFPGILRGVVMFRGTTEILDDEYADVTRLFIASERMADPPKPIEFYHAEQLKAHDLKVPIDLSPLVGAQTKINKAMQKIRLIPRQLEDAKKRALGQAPPLGITPEEAMAAGSGMIQEQINMLSALEDKFEALKTRLNPFSHVVPLDFGFIGGIKAKLTAASGKFETGSTKLAEMRQGMAAWQKDLHKVLTQKLTPEQMKAFGLDRDFLAPKKVNPWHDRGFPLAVAWRKNLEKNADMLAKLHQLGFQTKTIQRAWLGLSDQPLSDDPSLWGLPSPTDEVGSFKEVSIPAGLVLPRFEGPVLNRLVVRPGDPVDGTAEVLVPGSIDAPLALMADVGAPAVRVADELEAHFLWQEAGDCFSIFVLPDPQTKPQGEAAKALEAAPSFQVILPASFGQDDHLLESWPQKYPQAKIKPLPQGENLFEAVQAGVDVRAWLLEDLPDEPSADQGGLAVAVPAEGKRPGSDMVGPLTLPPLNIKGMVDTFIKDINAFLDSQMAPLKALQKEAEDQARPKILALGLDPESFSTSVQTSPAVSVGRAGEAGLDKIARERSKLKAMGLLTPEIDGQLNDAAACIGESASRGEALMNEGLAKIEAARKSGEEIRAKAKSGELPAEVKEKLDAAGVDPEKLKKLTRAEVLERYARGESLAQTNLSGLDLSGVEMPGVDLREANCQKTVFTGSRLDGANLTQLLGNSADFSGCTLKKATMDKAVLVKALFKEADLQEAVLVQTMLNKADLTKADFTGARLRMTIMQKANLTGANFKQAVAAMSIFSGANASETTWSEARLEKCYFKGTRLDLADFSGAILGSTMLWGVNGKQVRFTGANLTKARMGGQTSLPGADFSKATLHQACLRDSNLSGADFRGSTIEEALIESCDLTEAQFVLTTLKKSRLNKCNLTSADMRGADLFMGSLRKSKLDNTDLRGSNLYAVDFFKVQVNPETKFHLANLKMTQLQHRMDLFDHDQK